MLSKIRTLSAEQCCKIQSALSDDSLQWVPFTFLVPDEDSEEVSIKYAKCVLNTLPPEMLTYILDAAPMYNGTEAHAVVINRYLPGDFILPHVDRGNFCYLITVPLQTGVDGITVDGIFYQDEVGMGLPLKRKELWHHVSPVKELRYSMLYLYGKFE